MSDYQYSLNTMVATASEIEHSICASPIAYNMQR